MLCESLYQEMKFSNNLDIHSKYTPTRSISAIASFHKYDVVSIEGLWTGLCKMFSYCNNILQTWFIRV